MDYNPDCPAWGNLTWPKVGEFNLANGGQPTHLPSANRINGASGGNWPKIHNNSFLVDSLRLNSCLYCIDCVITHKFLTSLFSEKKAL